MSTSTLRTAATWARRAAALVLLADAVHVYNYYNEYFKDDQDYETPYDDERLYEDKKILDQYSGDCPPESLVTDEEFEEAVEAVLVELENSEKKIGLYPEDHPTMLVNRESVVFAGGGRATFLQLAHPFIAAGIRDHSYLARGVSKRFYNTFRLIFPMNYGTPQEVAKAARIARGMHNKVRGTLGEDVGVFKTNSKFDAAEKSALTWVASTLLDTAIFEYELHVRMLTEQEKDEMVKASPKLLMLFGVKPSKDDPKTYSEFRRYMSAMYRSKVISVSETAKDTSEYLLLPPSPLYAPALNMITWSTTASLPPRLAKQYIGRDLNMLDKLFFVVFHAIVRFVYRLTPVSFRFLTAYWEMYDRIYPGKRSSISKALSNFAAAFTNRLLAMAMPDRNPEEAMKKVEEKRKKRVTFQKV